MTDNLYIHFHKCMKTGGYSGRIVLWRSSQLLLRTVRDNLINFLDYGPHSIEVQFISMYWSRSSYTRESNYYFMNERYLDDIHNR